MCPCSLYSLSESKVGSSEVRDMCVELSPCENGNCSDEPLEVVTLTLERSVAMLLLTAVLVCSYSQYPLSEVAVRGAVIKVAWTAVPSLEMSEIVQGSLALSFPCTGSAYVATLERDRLCLESDNVDSAHCTLFLNVSTTKHWRGCKGTHLSPSERESIYRHCRIDCAFS